ncbi:MAG TPA: 30S ribosomal protein S7 [candidate division Zixibacteria bacterium]|nr:30S ribosomal protein S7 [candidate division Zixibacteria bacterium]
MPRRKQAPKRPVVPDSRFGDIVVSQFVNALMGRGKKSVAEKIIYSAIDVAEKRSGEEAGLDIFHKALNNVKPALEVKSRRVGGATYQVPVEVRPRRRAALAMRWLITAAHGRSEKSMGERLAAEFVAAAKNEGTAVKKREDTHRMAEANKAFAHFRW